MNTFPDDAGILVKKIKPNFKTLGVQIWQADEANFISCSATRKDDIRKLEQQGDLTIEIENTTVDLLPADVEITTEDIPGWSVATQNKLTALDMTLTPELLEEAACARIGQPGTKPAQRPWLRRNRPYITGGASRRRF